MKRSSILVFLFLAFQPVFSQQTATGFVFEDSNENGKKERRERGIPGVTVSNGVQVVVTDEKGKYSLPVGDDNILFVVKPSGYALPLDENNLPQFFYIHKPEGSPSLNFEAVAPTGKLPKSVDFALYKAEEKEDFTAYIFGDSQPYTEEELGYFAKSVVEKAKGEEGVIFGITLGDLVGDDLTLHPSYAQTVRDMGLPWFNVMGNHDMNYDAKVDEHSDESFEATFGPANYAFNYGKAHFIVLDDILYPDPRDGQGYWGGYRKDQLDFVENYLKLVDKNSLILVAQHIPLYHIDEGSFRDADRQRLFDVLKDFENVLAFSAHTHYQRHHLYGQEDGWKGKNPFHEFNAGTTNGDWYSGKLDDDGLPVSTMRDGTPKGYTLLAVDGTNYELSYRVLGQPKDHQMHIFHPKVVANNRGTQAGIFVNFYMGHQDDKVEYRVGNGEWKEMTWVEAPDPQFSAEVMEWDTAENLMPGRRPSNPVNSAHLWRGSIPTNLGEGLHSIEVRATDMFGRTYQSSSEYRLSAPLGQK
ncbi:calcineurin-like phosphoesterase C-terminal domain-containing protein [Pleomorphovibrio marinus]|uniref:calcineurin-like phosphoesterase C-terminal domain-containing protein n=1 Tax=Pleomorphovibrio marinus TaxID=2164132 RepID=UPI000E0A9F4C|nr:calcineurin-like phosphoesterase C-terminal domain-containing protein [Pleomorphovibrio marinus]